MARFHFKKFSLNDDNTPMKIGMDSVMLGAWAEVPKGARAALDIGSGCGLLSFMLAQRYENLKVTGVEINEGAFGDSLRNLADFYKKENVKFIKADIRELALGEKFDYIISNPPYFGEKTISPHKGRAEARSQGRLDFEILAENVKRFLNLKGSFAVIIPKETFFDFSKSMISHGLFLNRKMQIRHYPHSQVKRLLLEYGFTSAELTEDELVIKTTDNVYTEKYKKLTEEFYIKWT